MLKRISKLEDRTKLVFSYKRITEDRVRRSNTCLIEILRWEKKQVTLPAGLKKKKFTPRHEIMKMQSTENKEVTNRKTIERNDQLPPMEQKWGRHLTLQLQEK